MENHNGFVLFYFEDQKVIVRNARVVLFRGTSRSVSSVGTRVVVVACVRGRSHSMTEHREQRSRTKGDHSAESEDQAEPQFRLKTTVQNNLDT